MNEQSAGTVILSPPPRKRLGRAGWSAVFLLSIWGWIFLVGPVTDVRAAFTIDTLLSELHIPSTAKQRILDGEVVGWTTEESSDHELAVGLALYVKETPKDLLKFFRKAVEIRIVKEVKAYGEIKGKGTLADFAGVKLEPNGDKEAERYLKAEPGETLNLSAQEIAAFRALNGGSPDAAERKKAVEGLVRQSLLVRYHAYRAKGLSGAAPYERGGGGQRFPGKEVLGATKSAHFINKHLPSARQALLEYPSIEAKNVEQWFYWVNIEVFGRPTFILSHRMLKTVDNSFFAVDRHFYASHDYNALQAVWGAVPTEDGALLIYLNRVSTEQVGGFGSSVKHPVARVLMIPHVKGIFEAIRALAEKD